MAKTGKITLFTPHDLQRRIISELQSDDINLVAVNCGRQVGKSTLGWNWLLKQTLSYVNVTGAWVSRWHKQSNKVFKQVEKSIVDMPMVDYVSKIDKSIVFKNKSELKFFSAENYEAIRGESIKFLVCDEFALFKKEAWDEAIRPVLAAQKGYKALLLSTPRGKGFWFDLCMMAEEKDNWSFIKAPSTSSPFVDPTFIEDARQTMPKNMFRQEMLAEFLDDAGELFENVSDLCSNIRVNPSEANEYSQIVAAIDVGFKNDYTVATIFGKHTQTGQIVMLDIFREKDESVDYKAMSSKLYKFLKSWSFPKCRIEINMHDSVYSFLKEKGTPRLSKYRTTSKNKSENINYLASLFSSRSIYMIDLPEVKEEFFNFGYEFNNGGKVSFSAQGQFHDDIVMSCAIAVSQLKSKSTFSGFHSL